MKVYAKVVPFADVYEVTYDLTAQDDQGEFWRGSGVCYVTSDKAGVLVEKGRHIEESDLESNIDDALIEDFITNRSQYTSTPVSYSGDAYRLLTGKELP